MQRSNECLLSPPPTVVLWIVGALTCVGAALRFYRLGFQSFWFDETFFADTASEESFVHIISYLKVAETHPPLIHFLSHWWIKLFGDGEAALRVIPALFGIASIPMIYRLGRQVHSARVGLVAALILTFSITQIYFSQEFRNYALLVFFTIASMDALLYWLDGHRKLSWLYYVGMTAGLFYTHLFGTLVMLSQQVFVLAVLLSPKLRAHGQTGRALLSHWLVLQALLLFTIAPWLPTLMSQFQNSMDVTAWIAIPRLTTVLNSLAIFLCVVGPPWGDQVPNALIAGVAAAICLVGGRAVVRWTRDSQIGIQADEQPLWVVRRGAALALIWMTVPLVFAFVTSRYILGTSIYTHRNLLIVSPALYLFVALLSLRIANLPAIRHRRICWMAAAAPTICVVALSIGHYAWYYGTQHKSDWRGAARYIEEHVDQGDEILLPSSWIKQAPLFYLKRRIPTQNRILDLQRDMPTAGRIWAVSLEGDSHDHVRCLGYELVENVLFCCHPHRVTVSLFQARTLQ